MFTRLENLYGFVDQTVASIQRQHPKEVQCKQGCADCCHGVFDISFIEAAYLARFLDSHREILLSQRERAETAALLFEQLIKNGEDPSMARIRCPLLGEDDLCLAHAVRPINCRTYGTPTVIKGRAHVCGLSGFDSKGHYPTIDLAPLQQSLQDYSAELAGEEVGSRRFPIAWVVLRLDYFLPPR